MEQNLDQVKEKATEFSGYLTQHSTELVIFDTSGLEVAAEYSRKAKDEIKNIEAAFKPHKDNAFKAHRDLCGAESEAVAPFKKILSILRPKVIKYTDEVAGKLRKEKQDRERKQREAEAEAKRIAEETKEKHAEVLMDSGDLEKAEAVLESPIVEVMPAVLPDPEPVKVKGAGTKQVWKARVLDFSKVKDMFKSIDQKGIDRMAKICQDRTTEPGLEFYQETRLTGK